MTIANSENMSSFEDDKRWLMAIASLAVGSGFFALWLWLLPLWLGFDARLAGAARWRWLAAIPSVLGFAVALRCVCDFAWTGHGSPAPFAPPQRLVVVGFYRYVRNPIYLGGAAGWIGLWIVFGHANLAGIAMAAAALLAVHLFVVCYEEPTLRKKFGSDYEEYCRNVRRWWPRYFPPKHGFRFGFFTIPPDMQTNIGQIGTAAGVEELQQKLPGMMEVLEIDHPGMHTTDTVDFDVVISGEVYLELDDGTEVHLNAGDCVIQNGTRHAWHNRAAEKCVIAVTLVGAERKR